MQKNTSKKGDIKNKGIYRLRVRMQINTLFLLSSLYNYLRVNFYQIICVSEIWILFAHITVYISLYSIRFGYYIIGIGSGVVSTAYIS